jgi:hypothetical protein
MALQLQKAGVCKNVALNEEGIIVVSDIFGEQVANMPWVPLISQFVNVEGLFNDFKECKMYALADPLKRVAIDLLGLPEEKVYGTDEDKNEITHLLWENMPGITTVDYFSKGYADVGHKTFGVEYHEPGSMTIREVLQYVGTDIFRKMVPDVWMDALLRRIEKEQPKIALVSDVRFDNEIVGLQEAGGNVIGLTRNSSSTDGHKSEQINLDLCSTVLDNADMSIKEQCDAMNEIIATIL